MKASQSVVLVSMIAGLAGCASPQNAPVAVSASGEVAPGVYGRVDVRNGPPPPLVYPEPVLIVPLVRSEAPVYMHVPPAHAKRWSMFCHRYHACEQPVYFVKSKEYEADEARANKRKGDKDDEDARRYRQR
jgi:hypothetical protein